MRTIDEEARLILSDPASSEQLRRLADTVLECRSLLHAWEQYDLHEDCIDDGVHDEACRERDAANARAKSLQRDLEADRRHSAQMREMLEAANDLLGNSHNTYAVEWRSRYLAWQRE